MQSACMDFPAGPPKRVTCLDCLSVPAGRAKDDIEVRAPIIRIFRAAGADGLQVEDVVLLAESSGSTKSGGQDSLSHIGVCAKNLVDAQMLVQRRHGGCAAPDVDRDPRPLRTVPICARQSTVGNITYRRRSVLQATDASDFRVRGPAARLGRGRRPERGRCPFGKVVLT